MTGKKVEGDEDIQLVPHHFQNIRLNLLKVTLKGEFVIEHNSTTGAGGRDR